MSNEIIIPLMLILLIGLPHGAADILIGRRLFNGFFYLLIFTFIYFLIALIVILFWIKFPIIALLLFIGISISHFGLMDTYKTKKLPLRKFRAAIYGATPIIIPSLFHTDTVNEIFSILVLNNYHDITNIINLFFPIWFIGGLLFLWKGGSETNIELLEIYTISVLLIILPPLWGFAFYFCAIHSVRHSINIFKSIGPLSKSDLIYLIFIFSISLLLILFGTYISMNHTVENGLIRSTFITLAALTLPHIILIDIFKGLTLIKKFN